MARRPWTSGRLLLPLYRTEGSVFFQGFQVCLSAISFPGCCLRNALGDWDQKGLHSLSSYQVQGPQDEVNTFLQLLQCKYHSSVLFVCLFLIKWKTPGRAVKGKMVVVLLSRVFGTSAFSLVFST